VTKVNHYTMPLRRIVKREKQGGRWYVVLVCLHASPGRPASRFSRYYPCVTCAERVARVGAVLERQAAEERANETPAERLRRERIRRMGGGTFAL